MSTESRIYQVLRLASLAFAGCLILGGLAASCGDECQTNSECGKRCHISECVRGACVHREVDNGISCSTAGDEPGMCQGGTCVASTSDDGGVDATCGDGKIENIETCDDDNTVADDGCSSNCQVEVGWTCPAFSSCAPICGDGLVVGSEECDPNAASGPACTSECMLAPDVSIVDAWVSPPLLPGVEHHFTGVTHFIVAEISSAAAEVSFACTDGPSCEDVVDVSPPLGDPPLSEVTLPFYMAEGSYRFELIATLNDATSPAREVLLELRDGLGELKCEQWTDGGGDEEARRFGFQLTTPGGAPIGNADYEVYERRTTGEGWALLGSYVGQGFVQIIGTRDSLPDGVNYYVMAVDRGSTPATAEAAREFIWNEPLSGLTRGCEPCSRGIGGSCLIIPLQ
jgi:cysteine-rich repeat protein